MHRKIYHILGIYTVIIGCRVGNKMRPKRHRYTVINISQDTLVIYKAIRIVLNINTTIFVFIF